MGAIEKFIPKPVSLEDKCIIKLPNAQWDEYERRMLFSKSLNYQFFGLCMSFAFTLNIQGVGLGEFNP